VSGEKSGVRVARRRALSGGTKREVYTGASWCGVGAAGETVAQGSCRQWGVSCAVGGSDGRVHATACIVKQRERDNGHGTRYLREEAGRAKNDGWSRRRGGSEHPVVVVAWRGVAVRTTKCTFGTDNSSHQQKVDVAARLRGAKVWVTRVTRGESFRKEH